MAKVVILGAGAMGSALTIPLADNKHNIYLVGTHLDTDIINEIRNNHLHPKLKTQLPKTVIPYTYDQLSEATIDTDLIILGVSSLGINWAAEVLSPILSPNASILMVTKGLEGTGQNLQILPDVLHSKLPASCRDQIKLGAIGGPSIATELANRHQTAVIIGSANSALLNDSVNILATPYYHIWTSTDLIGIEMCAALKNLYTLGVGFAAGFLKRKKESEVKMHNLASAIFAQASAEIAYLVKTTGGQSYSVHTLAGMGDFYVTCQSGRNCRMGYLLGLGLRYSEAKSQYMPDDTVEGAELAKAIAPTISTMFEQRKLESKVLPLLQTLISAICHDTPVEIPWDSFFYHYKLTN